MRFFTDPTPFTHRVRFYGFPAYATFDGDGCDLSGTNLLTDFCVQQIAPHLHLLCETIRALVQGVDYEPGDWPIEIVRELKK